MAERRIIWMPWRGHNARVLAARERARQRWFGWGYRLRAYPPALPPLPVFFSPEAAARAARERRGSAT